MKGKIIGSRLKKGDTVGIVSVSAPEAFLEEKRFSKGIVQLQKRGYNVLVSENCCGIHGYLSATTDKMVQDFNNMILNPAVKAIVCAGGGSNANRILTKIDYKSIETNPKIIMGISNPTVLINAINTMTGLITFHGPSIVWDFGEGELMENYTKNNCFDILENACKNYEFSTEGEEWECFRGGRASGELVGGNLISLQCLLGTRYEPIWDNKILFWEDVCKPIDKLDMMLMHFETAGVFEKISGMIIGKLVSCEPNENSLSLDEMLTEVLGKYRFPVIKNVSLGHTARKLTLPVGGKVDMDSDNKALKLKEIILN